MWEMIVFMSQPRQNIDVTNDYVMPAQALSTELKN